MFTLIAVSWAWLSTAPAFGQDPNYDRKCEYGVTLALSGELEEAEKVFVSLLSAVPGDARAYVNLGNIHLLLGRFETALQFYDRALRQDNDDAGILLNRSTALMLLGQDEQARDAAARGIEMAGGADAAAHLLGLNLQTSTTPESKASDQTYVMKEEVRSLLQLAATPPDSTGTAATSDAEQPNAAESKRKKRLRVWHSSGPRAAEQSDAASVLYWKRGTDVD